MCMKFIYWIIFCVFRFTAGVDITLHTTVQLPLLYHHSTATVYAGEDDVERFM